MEDKHVAMRIDADPDALAEDIIGRERGPACVDFMVAFGPEELPGTENGEAEKAEGQRKSSGDIQGNKGCKIIVDRWIAI